MEVELDSLDQHHNNIFGKKNFEDMGRRVYWGLISAMFGLTIGLLSNSNIFIMFIIVLCVGVFNPDDRIKGKFP